MCNYISDPSSYWHTGNKLTQRDSEYNRNHARFEISTNRRVKFNRLISEGIFEFQSLINKTDEIIKLNPFDATINVAYDTYWDSDEENEYSNNREPYNHHWMNTLNRKNTDTYKLWERAKRSIQTVMIYWAKSIKWSVGEFYKVSYNYKGKICKIKCGVK